MTKLIGTALGLPVYEERTAHGADGKFTSGGGGSSGHRETHGAISVKSHFVSKDPTKEYVPTKQIHHVIEVHKGGVKIGEAHKKGNGDYVVKHPNGTTSKHFMHEEAVSAIAAHHGHKPFAAEKDHHGNTLKTHWK